MGGTPTTSVTPATRAVAIVVAGGPLRPWPGGSSPEFTEVIAVDGGLDVALAAGLRPSRLIGDLDSISSSGLAWAAANQIPVERHPADKDDTDTALALGWFVTSGLADHADLVLLAAGQSERLDHVLGTIGALGASPLRVARSITAHIGSAVVMVLHPGSTRTRAVCHGSTVSLLALHGSCDGVSIAGTKWELLDAMLPAASTLGISNVAIEDTIVVTVAEGVLTVIVAGHAEIAQ